MSEVEKEPVLWSCDKDAEYLRHGDINEAVSDHLDSIDNLKNLPENIMAFGYARLVVNRDRFKNVILECAQEWLDENYSGEDGHNTLPETEKACENFIDTYINGFTPWQCEQVESKEINVKEWILLHRPEWTKESL